MGQPTAMLDFFVLEASDYLERLDVVAQAPAGAAPAGDEFVRLARAFRGSALMANQQVMARAGQGLESVARSVRDGRLAWDERVRGEVIRAVDDCKILLRRVKSPETGDAQRAEGIGLGLERLAGRPPETARAQQAGSLDAGGRAFVGREAAAIASTLDRVARALTLDPGSRDPLNSIAPAMSQLRGVAILNDLPPLADLLSAVDGAVRLVHGAPGPVPGAAARVFDAAAKALARAAREVVEAGRPVAESDEAQSFASAVLRTFVVIGDPVPIELLCATESGSPVVSAGTPPAASAAPPRLELVSQGEFLAAAAIELGRASSGVLRDLRLFVIGSSLKPLIESDGSALGRSLAGFAEAGWWAIGAGSAAAEPERFAEVVSDAASTLRSAESGDEGRLAQLLHAHASRLLLRLPYPLPERAALAAPAPAAPAPPVAAPVPAAPRVAVPAPAQVVAPPAPIAPPRMPARPAPAAPPSTAPAAVEGGLAASWTAYEALVAQRGPAAGSLEEFLGPAPATAAVAAAPLAAAPAPAPELPIVPIESLAPGEPDVVPIESLLFDRDGALRRLREVRTELDAALAAAGTAHGIRTLLGEVFDLVDIGFGTGS